MNDVTEEVYGFPHTDRTELCGIHNVPMSLCNKCGDGLADREDDNEISELQSHHE